MDGESEWSVTYMDGADKTIEQVWAEGFQVGPNGDLLLGRLIQVTEQGIRSSRFETHRAFAAGVWQEIHLYG